MIEAYEMRGEDMALNYQYEPGRIFVQDQAGRLLAQISFPTIADGLANFTSTFVDPSLRGQGIGDQLVQAAIAKVKEHGMKAVVTCSYVRAWFNKHPGEAAILIREGPQEPDTDTPAE